MRRDTCVSPQTAHKGRAAPSTLARSEINEPCTNASATLCRYVLHLAHHCVDALCDIINIARVQPSHGDAAILGHVDVKLICHALNLWC